MLLLFLIMLKLAHVVSVKVTRILMIGGRLVFLLIIGGKR